MTQDSRPSTSESSAKSSNRKPHIVEHPRTLEEVLQAGERAASLLRSEEFNLAYQMAYDSYVTDFVNSAPHEANKREYAYVKVQSLTDVVNQLAALVNNASAAIAQKEADENDFEEP